ncbi:MAG: hypothetical protein RSD53_02950, partial [Algoriella sp.]
MKKLIFRAIFCTTLFSSTAFITSCSNDDDSSTSTPSTQELTPDNFKGTIKSGQNLTLDATKTYYLTGIVTVEDGATLTIP